MSKIVFISCVSKKLSRRAKAKDLYTSPLFRMNLAYAHSLHADQIFILSAKYGLLNLEQEIEPYNQTLNDMTTPEIKNWAESVKKQMEGKIDFKSDLAVFLAGMKYRKFLLPLFQKTPEVPLEGLPIGKQLHYLRNKLNYAK